MNARRLGLIGAVIFLLAPAQAADRSVAPIISRIVRAPVDSSAVNAIGYSKRLHALEIEFHDGLIYRYQEVPQPVYLALLAAESKARYYNQHVRGKFHCLRVRPRPPHK